MKTMYTTSRAMIQNANGTAERECSCGSWIGHWELFSGLVADTCSVEGCQELATVGAHVLRPKAENEAYKTHAYIVPMCASHNGKHGERFRSKENVTFVWANKAETCGA